VSARPSGDSATARQKFFASFFQKRSSFFLLFLSLSAFAQNPAVTISIDATKGRHAISPLIYGVAFGTASDLVLLNAPLNREGGDSTSTYSWRANALNLAADYYFESYPQAGGGTAGAYVDGIIAGNAQAGARSLVTVPMIGWVAKLGPDRARLPSFSIGKYGPECASYNGQSGTDPYFPDAGIGVETNCQTFITGNSPDDAYVRDSTGNEEDWVKHLVAKWGGAAGTGPSYYLTDNESSIWFVVHRDVHPIGPHATEIRDDVIRTSAFVKAIDPAAQVVGPEEYGWFGYFYSGYDQQYLELNGFNLAAPDRTKVMGGMDYIPWLLSQWKAAGHPIDVLSVHFYPGCGEFGNATGEDDYNLQILRNASTRQLWDPTYTPPCYPSTPVMLIPRLQGWISSYYYPNTPVAITEYNWGDEDNINGATTQADIFGIFGAYGVQLGTRWTVPYRPLPSGNSFAKSQTPTFKAMQIYRNYDGHNSGFGDTAIQATFSSSPDDLTAYAAIRTLDGAMTIMVINKDLSGSTPVSIGIGGFSAGGPAAVYQLTGSDAIAALPAVKLAAGGVSLTVPAQSVTLLVVPAEGAKSVAPPTATMRVDPAQTYAPAPGGSFSFPVHFVGAGAAHDGGTIVSEFWDFGDGSFATGTRPTHSYTGYGNFNATLTVRDSLGLAGTITKSVSVQPPPQAGIACTATFADTADYGSSFLGNVLITNTGSQTVNGWVVTWNWPGNQMLAPPFSENLWNASGSQTETSVSALSAGSIAPGGTANPNFFALYIGSNPSPTKFYLNGTPCSLVPAASGRK
jgi:hypothetical protein